MPTDAIIVIACICAVFAVFAAALIYSDMTWKTARAGHRLPARTD